MTLLESLVPCWLFDRQFRKVPSLMAIDNRAQLSADHYVEVRGFSWLVAGNSVEHQSRQQLDDLIFRRTG